MESNKIIEDICNQYERNQYAMYLRKSRADLEMEALGEGETLARHLKMLETLAAKHDIHPDQITIYKEVVSGDSIDDRPEMQKLLSDVCAKKYKGVLVVEVERLARGNTKDQGEVAEAFQMSNTHIITPAKVYDPNNEFDQEYFEFGLFMSRREYKTIRRRLEAGKKQSVVEGNYIASQRIFGYDVVRKSKKERILVERPEEAKIVQMIFDWYTIENKSTMWIALELTRMGIPTTTGISKEWHRNTIRDMIANVHYIGKVTWGKQQTVKVLDDETGKLVKKRVYKEPEIFEGKHKGIISVEQFELAQAITKEKCSPVKISSEMRNPLSGLLWCSVCGCHMALNVYSDGRRRRYQHPTKITCKKKSAPVDAVMDALILVLKAYIKDYDIKMETEDNQADLIRHQETIKAMESELAKMEKKRRKLFLDYEDEVYTRDEFIERKQHYAAEIEGLKAKIQEARQSVPEPVDYKERITTLHKLIDCLGDQNLSAKEKNVFLKKYIDRIDYDIIDYGGKKGGKPVLDVRLK